MGAFRSSAGVKAEKEYSELSTREPVVFTTEAAETIRAAAHTGLEAIPKRGAEIGGLLTASSVGESPLVIDGAELVAIEYRYGPSYRLSSGDVAALRDRAEQIRSSGTRHVVGFFRSNTEEPFNYNPEDISILREFLPEAEYLLVARPFHDGHLVARLFESHAGEWNPSSEFEVERAAFPLKAPAQPTPEVPQLAPAPVLRAARRLSWKWLLAGLIVIAAGLGAAYFAMNRVSYSPSDLHLRVSTEGGEMRIGWEGNAPSVRSASGGTLRVEDGGRLREITLTPEQLAAGNLLYRQAADDVTFRLQVTESSGKSVSEMTRVVDGNRPLAPVAAVNPAKPFEPDKSEFRIRGSENTVTPSAGSYAPPQPIHQVMPRRKLASHAFGAEVRITVLVHINSKGVVTYAQPLLKGSTASKALVAEAVAAARHWVFRPARRDGKPIESDHQILFRFSSQ